MISLLVAAILVNGLVFALLIISLWRLKRTQKKVSDRHELQEAYMLGRSRPPETTIGAQTPYEFMEDQLGRIRGPGVEIDPPPQPFEPRSGGHYWDSTTRTCRACGISGPDFLMTHRRCQLIEPVVQAPSVQLTANVDLARDQADAVALNLSTRTISSPEGDAASQAIQYELRRIAEAEDRAREAGLTRALDIRGHFFEPATRQNGSHLMLCTFCGLDEEYLSSADPFCPQYLVPEPLRFQAAADISAYFRSVEETSREREIVPGSQILAEADAALALEMEATRRNGLHYWIADSRAELPGAGQVCHFCGLDEMTYTRRPIHIGCPGHPSTA